MDLDRRLPTDTDEMWQAKQEARKRLAEQRMEQHDRELEKRL